MGINYDDLDDSGMAELIGAIEDNSTEIGESTSNEGEEAVLEDTATSSTDDSTTDTDTTGDDTEVDTDGATDDELGGEDTQDVEDDVDVDTDDDESEDGSADEVITDGVDDDVVEDELDDDDQTDGNDDDEIEDEGSNNAELEEFYREAQEVEYMVNGKKVKGLGTIDDMVKARQMAGGLNEKFKTIKELRPFLAPLKERGLIENPEKFNLAMQIIDGDQDALKQFMLDGGIDPLEMDMDQVDYTAKSSLSSNEEILYNDTLGVAKQYGVEDKFNKVILSDWDQTSLGQFFASAESATTIGTALAEQIENGLYDEVMSEVAKLESTDVHGVFGARSSIDKYNEASQIVNARNAAKVAPKVEEVVTPVVEKAKVEKAKQKILDKRQKEEYASKVAEKNKRADAKRKEATAASKTKTKVAPTKSADPYSLDGDELDSFVDALRTTFR